MTSIKRNSISPFLPTRSRLIYTARGITLLELLLGFTLILFAAGIIGWKGHAFFKKRRFTTEMKRFEERCKTLHRLAMNMQVDWGGVIQKDGDRWLFNAFCEDPSTPSKLSPLSLHFSELLWNGEAQTKFQIDFFSSGAIRPLGSLLIRDGKEVSQNWVIPLVFELEEGEVVKELGPIHPDET